MEHLRFIKNQVDRISKPVKTAVFLFIILLFFAGVANAYEQKHQFVYLDDNGVKTEVKTYASNIKEFLKEQNIIINEGDILSVNLDDDIVKHMQIKIDRKADIILYIDDEAPWHRDTYAKKIDEFIEELEEKMDCEYETAIKYDSSAIKDKMELKLISVKEEEVTDIQEIDFEITYVENGELEKGTEKVVQEGQKGERTIIAKKLYKGGNLEETTVISDSVTKEPVSKIIEKGTKEPVVKNDARAVSVNVDSGKHAKSGSLGREIKMKATAYTGGGTTASGRPAQVGVVAVDTRVIPLGTKLYIEGYGYAVAGDTGGAIKGNKIDLYFDTHKEAINFGVKNVKVYVIE